MPLLHNPPSAFCSKYHTTLTAAAFIPALLMPQDKLFVPFDHQDHPPFCSSAHVSLMIKTLPAQALHPLICFDSPPKPLPAPLVGQPCLQNLITRSACAMLSHRLRKLVTWHNGTIAAAAGQRTNA